MTEGRDLLTVDITEKARSQEYIDLEKGLKIGNDLTARISLVTESGLVITDQSVLIHWDGADLDSLEYFRKDPLGGELIFLTADIKAEGKTGGRIMCAFRRNTKAARQPPGGSVFNNHRPSHP